MKKLKLVLFYAAILIPLGLLIILTLSIVMKVFTINTIDYEKIYSNLENYLKADKGQIGLSLNEGELTIRYNYKIKEGPYKPRIKKVKFTPNPDNSLIYVYGSSPVVAKLPLSKDLLFPALLEKLLNSGRKGKEIELYNFGLESFDSFDIKKLLEATVEFKKPNLIIFYEGHMDYESAYIANIKREFYFLRGKFFRYLFGVAFLKQAYTNIDPVKQIVEIGDWVIRATVEPNLLNLVQRASVVTIPSEPFKRYNRLIESYYGKNVKEIIALCNEYDVLIIFVVPVANLHAKPFGIYDITQRYYKLGLAEEDYHKRIAYLNKAKDSEIFTGDLRAKTAMNDFLRTLNQEDVYVLDLENELIKEKNVFDYQYFYDIGHVKPRLHKMIADYLYDFITENVDFSSLREAAETTDHRSNL